MVNSTLLERQRVQHIPYLDGWRGLAILCVLSAHFSSYDHFGGLGVTIFFVLSGILMSRILFVENTSLITFYRRRGARILPVFVLYLVVVFTLWKILFDKSSATEFAYTLLFLRTYMQGSPISHSDFPIGHLWSLNVEEHSYVLLSIITLLVARGSMKAVTAILAGCSLLCLGFFFYYKMYPPAAPSLFTQRSEIAAFPLLLSSTIYMLKQHYPLRAPRWLAIAALAAAFLVAALTTSVFARWLLTAVLCAVAVNALEMSPTWFLRALSHPALTWFGVCSYSIYLWQQIFYYCNRYFKDVAYYNAYAIGISLVVASGSYYFYEQPLRRWLAGKR